jgi:hypothetical protein
MPIEYLILKNEPNSLTTRFVQAYLRNSVAPSEVRRAEVVIPLNAGLGTIDLQAAWASGTVIPNGPALWNQLDLDSTEDLGRGAIGAILDVVRSSGTLAQMTAAGLAVIDDAPKQLIAYNRIKAAMDAATLQQVKDFVSLLAVIAYSKIGQRRAE